MAIRALDEPSLKTNPNRHAYGTAPEGRGRWHGSRTVRLADAKGLAGGQRCELLQPATEMAKLPAANAPRAICARVFHNMLQRLAFSFPRWDRPRIPCGFSSEDASRNHAI